MILLLDNYDSFVYNLARYVRELGEQPVVRRHDALSVDEVAAMAPSHIIISPGPCSPAEAGISTEVVRRLGATTPILGVCLGHQCIGAAYGGEIVRAGSPMHGKTSMIRHRDSGLFEGLPNPFRATRYHSLVIAPDSVPDALEVLATSEDGEIMAVQHREHPVHGLQFHPESVLTEHGYRLIDHFLHGMSGSARPLPLAADGALAPGGPEASTMATDPPSVDLVRRSSSPF
jgi:anthranilate synthase component 2